MRRWQCPIYYGTLENFIWSISARYCCFSRFKSCSGNEPFAFVNQQLKIISFQNYKRIDIYKFVVDQTKLHPQEYPRKYYMCTREYIKYRLYIKPEVLQDILPVYSGVHYVQVVYKIWSTPGYITCVLESTLSTGCICKPGVPQDILPVC